MKRPSSISCYHPLLTSFLNVDRAVAPRWQLWLFAWIGIVAQLAVLVFGALTTYHWKFEKGGAPIALYGYPCTLAGTLTVSVGLLLCFMLLKVLPMNVNSNPVIANSSTGVLDTRS